MASENALSKIIDFQPIIPVTTIPTERTRQVTFYCQPLDDSITQGYQLVSSKDDLINYTSDTRAGAFFDNGHNQIYLLFVGFTEEDIQYVSARTFSLVVSPDVGDDASVADFGSFNGVKYYTEDNSVILDGGTIANELATTFGNSIWYADESSNLKERFSGWLTSKSLNPNWRAGQYKQFSGEPVIIKNNTEVDKARHEQLSFCYADGLEISTPAIFYARAGGINLVDYYIAEDIINQIQLNSYLYIANNDPTYIDVNIGVLVSIGKKVLNNFADRGLIVLDGSSYSIPSREEQAVIDVTNGLVNGAELIIESGSAIWYLTGTVQATISDTVDETLTVSKLANNKVNLSDSFMDLKLKFKQIKNEVKSNKVDKILSMKGEVIAKNKIKDEVK